MYSYVYFLPDNYRHVTPRRFPDCYQILLWFSSCVVRTLPISWKLRTRLFALPGHQQKCCGSYTINGHSIPPERVSIWEESYEIHSHKLYSSYMFIYSYKKETLVMYICVNELTIIGSDNGLAPTRRQAIIWTNVRTLVSGPLGQTSMKF